MEHDDTHEQPQVVNEVIRNYLVISSSWFRWMDQGSWWFGERERRRPLIDNEGLELQEGNDLA